MNIAILIDAENVLPGHADLIFAHAQKLGDIVSKEIFGAATALSTWVAPVLKYAIHPNLTIKAAKGKNSSDIALVIGAMDLLVKGNIDCAIIASSDSDFSALSVRLRNAGIEVVGMGTDKSNDLWRTACSSFVVLQNQKPSQAARQEAPSSQSDAPKQNNQKQSSKKPARAANGTHEERVAVIRKLISRLLESHGGRVQTSTLFPSLNQLPEYRVDRQGSGKKPLNYLTSTYGDAFRFEDAADGQNWVFLPGVAPVEPMEQPAEPSPAPETGTEAPAQFQEAVDVVEAQAAEPGPEPEAESETAAEAAAEEAEGYVTPQQVIDKLVEGGFDPEIARQVTEIFADSTSYRAAYNKLRSVFGNNTGRDYYQQAKELLTAE